MAPKPKPPVVYLVLLEGEPFGHLLLQHRVKIFRERSHAFEYARLRGFPWDKLDLTNPGALNVFEAEGLQITVMPVEIAQEPAAPPAPEAKPVEEAKAEAPVEPPPAEEEAPAPKKSRRKKT